MFASRYTYKYTIFEEFDENEKIATLRSHIEGEVLTQKILINCEYLKLTQSILLEHRIVVIHLNNSSIIFTPRQTSGDCCQK